MPTLQRRVDDGGYYIRHFFHEHHTWQILGDGITILANRNIREGNYFRTELFMELLRRGLIYHGIGPTHTSAREPKPLDAHVAEYYRFIYAGDTRRAWPYLAASTGAGLNEGETLDQARNRFVNDIQERSSATWRVIDIRIIDAPFEATRVDGPAFKATQIAIILLRLTLSDGQSAERRELWAHSEGCWWVIMPALQRN